MHLREVKKGDIELLYNWKNDKKCIENSFLKEKISYKEHEKWFQEVYKEDSILIWILEDKERSIGVVRVKLDSDIVLSYSIDEKYRGMGYGKGILKLLEDKLVDYKGKVLTGYVKKTNLLSCKIFISLGYNCDELNDRYKFYKKLEG